MPRITWKTRRKQARHRWARLTAGRAARAHRGHFAEVERFCFFLGFPRSGSSLVGQLLNAHHSVVIANEVDALRHLREGRTRDQLFGMILERDRQFRRQGWTGASGYEFGVEGQWQGRFDRLQVIGDKRRAAPASSCVWRRTCSSACGRRSGCRSGS